jgi:short-subunit dehydrogenase
MEKVALVTGGTSGIGLALCEQFASHGIALAIVSHNQENLDQTSAFLTEKYGIRVFTVLSDLTHEDSAEEVYAKIKEKGLIVEYLVNNAGVGTYGDFLDSYVEDNENIVQIDVVSLIDLTYHFLHEMVERKSGYILNVSSTAAFQPGPRMAVYYASKAFVLSFSEALHEELKGAGVKVTCLCPGPTKSAFLNKSGMEKSSIVKRFKPMEAVRVARAGYQGMLKGKAVVIPGAKNRFRAFAPRLLSRASVRRIMDRYTQPQK